MTTANLSDPSSAHQLALEQTARLASETREAAVRRLHRIVVALSTALTPADVASTILKDCFSAMDAAGGAIYMLDESDSGAMLLLLAESGHLQGGKGFESFPLALVSPLSDAARTREALFFKDRETCCDAYPDLRETMLATGFEAFTALPLVVNDVSVGVVGVRYATARSFDEADRSFLLMLAEFSAMALDRVRLIRDLTRDRKAAEEERAHATELAAALEEQRRLLDAVFQQAPLAIAIADAASGRVVAKNSAMDRIWQGSVPKHVTEPGTLRVSYEDGRPRHPDDSALSRALSGEAVTENVHVERADGSRAWIHVTSAPVRDETGAIIAAVGLGEDITEQGQLTAARDQLLKQVGNQRAQLSGLLQQLPVAAIVYRAPDFCVEMMNDAYRTVVGEREVVGCTLREAFGDLPGIDSTLEYLSEAVRLKETRVRRGYVAPLRDQAGRLRERVFNSTFQPLLDETGEVALIVVTTIEVTDEVRERKLLADFAERLRVILDEMPLGVIVRDARIRGRHSHQQGQQGDPGHRRQGHRSSGDAEPVGCASSGWSALCAG